MGSRQVKSTRDFLKIHSVVVKLLLIKAGLGVYEMWLMPIFQSNQFDK
jgi:hypothetical protein